MAKSIQAVRGMNDLLPEALILWQYIEHVARDIMRTYGYSEIRTPLLEKTELFARSIGAVTDIVEKEMYTFEDRNGDSLTLRPEGTASCVRAGIQNGLLHNQVQRLWYAGPMFRHERPQKGRYRQFHQIGVETFGMAGPDIDAELILMSARLWRALSLEGLNLQLNSLGTIEIRANYRKHLQDYLIKYRDSLDEDSLRRLDKNPLRILDSKNPAMQDIIANAPSLLDYLDTAARGHFDALKAYLDDAGVSYTINPRLVRGLDYYSHTVFEWTTDKLGAQSAVCAGGRFDGLVEQLGGKATAAAGFAIGLERVVELVSLAGLKAPAHEAQLYMVLMGERAERKGMRLGEQLRDAGFRVLCHCSGGSMKSQMRSADKSGAILAVILAEEEYEQDTVTIKYLREEKDQKQVKQSQLLETVKSIIT